MEQVDIETDAVVAENSEENQLQKRLSQTRQSLSLYEIGVFENKTVAKKNILSEYDELLQKETNQWTELVKSTNEKIKSIQNTDIEYGPEILGKEHIQHMNEVPNFEEFLENAIKFSIKCNNFLETYEETLELQKKLVKECRESVKNDILLNCLLEL